MTACARFACVVALSGMLATATFDAAALEAPPAIAAAIRQGDAAAALALIAAGADVAETEADGTTALHWAVRYGERELVSALLGAGANVSAANRYGMTALHLAAINGDAETLRLLLAAGADPNAVLPEGETVLMTAARTGDAEVLRALLEAGANADMRETWYGETALIWAAAEDHPQAVAVLVEHGADPDARSARQEFERRRLGQSILPLGEWTAMMYAARENALDAGRMLIELGADLDATDPDGATALVIAIINAHYDFAAMLLEAGSDPNIVDAGGMGPLYAAIDMHRLAVGHGRPNPLPTGTLDSVDIAGLLLEHGADPNAALGRPVMQRQHTGGDFTLGEGATPLLRAAKSGDIAMVRLLLGHGADLHHTMPDGSGALHYAAGLGWRNGSPLAPSYDQGTDAEAIETLELLLARGLAVDVRNAAGDSALHAAVTGRGSEAIIRFLVLDARADLEARNGKEQTPLDAARAMRSGEAMAALLEQIAAQVRQTQAGLTEPR